MLAMLVALTTFSGLADPCTVSLVLSNPNSHPGNELLYAIELTPQADWHLYWKNPGDSGLAPTIKWQLPEGWKASDLIFPAPTRLVGKDEVTYVYTEKVSLIGRIQVPANAELRSYQLKGTVSWMACNDSCLTGQSEVSADISVAKDASKGGSFTPGFLSAINRIPNQKLEAKVRFQGNRYILSATLPTRIKSAYFFSDITGVAEHAAQQKTQIKGNQLSVEVVKSEFASKPSAEISGVLEVTTDKGIEYYVIDEIVSR